MLDNFVVSDRSSFIKFLELLRQDLKSNPDRWTNRNLDDFLEAMTRYSEDIQGYYDNNATTHGRHINADVPTWRTFADILRGTTVYE